MPAPFGNQNAIGNEGGRPRIHKREELLQKLIEFSKKRSSTSLNQYCEEQDISPEYISRWSKEDIEFRQIMMIVRARLAARREEFMNMNAFSHVVYSGGLRYYDRFANEQWCEEKTFESNLKKNAEKEAHSPFTLKVVQKPWHDEKRSDDSK